MSARFGPDELLACYKRGVFPMAESREALQLFLVDPDWRGILPLDRFHVPSRLARSIRKGGFSVTVNRDFAAVLDGCAAPRADAGETWINPTIRNLYLDLHARGDAHSVETRDADGALIGGLYGVSLGGAFFGESMFSRTRDASKIALVYLAARLRIGGYRLLDAQFWTMHLSQFGAEQLPRRAFRKRLEAALETEAHFMRLAEDCAPAQVLQAIGQTS